MSKVNIGLFGFGVVGEGIYKVLEQKPQLGAEIKKVVIKQGNKERNAPDALFSTQANDILNNENIDLVVELIDDADAALDIVTRALRSGKSVISANKKMIAENLSFLIQTAQENEVSFLYEAAVCGSVPIIRNLEEYFNNDLIRSVTGIVNGSTNYILTQMTKSQLDYEVVLKKAQELGFAESDPSLDVEGWDSRNKLKIIALHAFGKLIPNEQIHVVGVDSISKLDIDFAREKGFIIKLIATCKVDAEGGIEEASVLPTFIPKFHPLRLTNNEFNGVIIGGELANEQFLYGKGAGRYPTSSAVLSDISAYLFDYKYEYKKSIKKVEEPRSVEKKFYISFPKDVAIDWRAYGKVEETYDSEDHCWVTLKGDTDEVLSLSKDHHVSIISYHE